MRSDYLFNYDWLYVADDVSHHIPDSEFEKVIIPHTNKIFPHTNFHENEYEFISTYRKHFTLPEERNGRRVKLVFEGIMTAATVTINNHTFEEQRGGFVPFEYDITDYLVEVENLLTVRVDSREREDIPPHGGRVDYLVFGGIYRDVRLVYVEPVYIENVFIRPTDVLTDSPYFDVDVYIRSNDTSDETRIINFGVSSLGIEQFEPYAPTIGMSVSKISFTVPITEQFVLWTLENPQLYDVQITLNSNNIVTDMYDVRIGFREAHFKEDGFYLNGEKQFLRGLNRHQIYPFVGAAVPDRLQARDAEIIKQYGCNIVRTSHYPQSKAFLDRCDEIGLLVFEEIPGWQHIGDEDWQNLSLRDVRAMIERDWNHPSIIIWSIRINESWDHHDFYMKTNALARELDPTRPTTGVRFFDDSELLEDVYGFNDFSNGIIEPTNSPWLVTEYNGHMFPTKTFDNEERQMEHVRRHAHVQAQAMSMGGVSGAIGWCAFDYNTHLEFGSGDRICYHGVFDMFRQPKWAAYVYRSQKSPDEEIVMQPATFWTMGDRAGGGNDPLYVLTNLDYIKVYVEDELHNTFYPNREDFPNLPHPPIKVQRLGLEWGESFGSLKIQGFLDDALVAEHHISADSIPQKLFLKMEDDELYADGIDMTRIVFKITDEHGNRLPYAIQPVELFVIEGDAEIIGENPFPMIGGQAALFLKAGTQTGAVHIKATTSRLSTAFATVNLVERGGKRV